MLQVRAAASRAVEQQTGRWPTRRPVAVAVRFFLDQPVSRRPDLDNLAKAVLDALAGGKAAGRWAPIVYLDDAQVVDLHLTKFEDAVERVEVDVHLGDSTVAPS